MVSARSPAAWVQASNSQSPMAASPQAVARSGAEGTAW